MTWVLHYTSSLLTKITRFQQSPVFAGGPRWRWVRCVFPIPAKKGEWKADRDVSEAWSHLSSPSVFPCRLLSNWVGLMSWQDFLLQAAVSRAVILQRGFDGVQAALLFPFPSVSCRGCPPLLSKQGWLKGPVERQQ